MGLPLELTDRTSRGCFRFLMGRVGFVRKVGDLYFSMGMKLLSHRNDEQKNKKSGFETFADHSKLSLMINQY